MTTVTGESKRILEATSEEWVPPDAGGSPDGNRSKTSEAAETGSEKETWYARIRSKVMDRVDRFTAYGSDLIGLKESRPMNRLDKVRIAVITAVTAIVAYGGGVLHAQKKPDSGVNELASGTLHALGAKDTSLDHFRSAKHEYDKQKNVLTVAQKENGEMKTALNEMRSKEKALREDLAKMEKRMAAFESAAKAQQTKIAALEGRLKRLDSRVVSAQIAARKAADTTVVAGIRSAEPVGPAANEQEIVITLPPKTEMLPKGQAGKSGVTAKKRHAAPSAQATAKGAPKAKITAKVAKAAPVSYEKLQEIKRKVEKDMDVPGMEIRMREYSGGKTKLWVNYRGHDSKGFFSTTPKFASRLTEDGMKAWAKDRMEYLSKFDAIENASKTNDISLGKPKAGTTEPGKIPYLEVSETIRWKARFLLVTPGGADMDFTVPLEDCTQAYLEPLLKKMKARSDRSSGKPAQEAQARSASETAPVVQVPPSTKPEAAVATPEIGVGNDDGGTAPKVAEEPKTDGVAAQEDIKALPEKKQVAFSPIGPFGEKPELKPIRGLSDILEPSDWTGNVVSGQNPWFPGNVPPRFVPKIPEGVGVLGR